MLHAFQEGQCVRAARASLSGVLTSGPRLRMSELKPELTPPYDSAAIPSYDVHFENNSRRTVPATELTPLLHLQPEDVSRRGSSTSSTSQWPALRATVGKNLAPLGLLIGFSAVIPFVGSWEWATKNNAALTLLVGLLVRVRSTALMRKR